MSNESQKGGEGEERRVLVKRCGRNVWANAGRQGYDRNAGSAATHSNDPARGLLCAPNYAFCSNNASIWVY